MHRIATFQARLARRPQAARAVLATALAALSLVASGCALFGGRPLREVSDSQLNWLNVRFHPSSKDQKPASLNIVGVGSVEFKQGRSPLVFNSFSQDVDNPLWGDIEEEKLGVTPAQARWMMQLFVDAGLTTEAKRMRSIPAAERNVANDGIAVITAKLNGEIYRARTNNPEIISVVEAIIDSIVSNRGFH